MTYVRLANETLRGDVETRFRRGNNGDKKLTDIRIPAMYQVPHLMYIMYKCAYLYYILYHYRSGKALEKTLAYTHTHTHECGGNARDAVIFSRVFYFYFLTRVFIDCECRDGRETV